jgi:hypothetical protein
MILSRSRCVVHNDPIIGLLLVLVLEPSFPEPFVRRLCAIPVSVIHTHTHTHTTHTCTHRALFVPANNDAEPARDLVLSELAEAQGNP